MTNKEKFIEIMNQTFNAGFTQENFAPAKNGSCPAVSRAGICSPCGFYKDRACLSCTCDGCKKWWEEEYKEVTQNGHKMTIKETAAMMCSEDYAERLKAEYCQLLIRHNKLRHMLFMWQGDSLNFKSACPRSLYELQTRIMSDYLSILEARAAIEGINLEGCVKYDD